MRLQDDPNRLLIQKVSRVPCALGALVVVVGGLCAIAAFGTVAKDISYPPAFRFGVGLLVGVAVAAGAWLYSRPPGEILVVDRVTQTVTLTCQGLLRRSVKHYPGPAVADVRVTKERDGDGEPVYQVELVFDTGSVVLLPLPRHDREECMRVAKHLWTALGLPRA